MGYQIHSESQHHVEAVIRILVGGVNGSAFDFGDCILKVNIEIVEFE